MKVEKTCNDCQKKFLVINTQEKGANGAWRYLHLDGLVALGSRCQECHRALKRDNWGKDDKVKIQYKKYELTPKGFIMRLYRNMKSRILGVQKVKHHLYEGKELISKEEFYEWALAPGSKFYPLFEEYMKSGRDMKLAPSVDRIDSSKGYGIGNMEWVTHSENSRRGHASRYSKRGFSDIL
jgi:hypothetical protein